MIKDTYVVSRQHWNGIEIEIRWSSDWLGYDDGTGIGHLEIQSIAPEDAPLPMTETGYRSHFIHPSFVAERGGPEEYVAFWLKQEAATPEWRVSDMKHRQGSLF